MDPLDTTLLEKDKKVKSSSRVSGFYFYQCHQLSSELFMLFFLMQKKPISNWCLNKCGYCYSKIGSIVANCFFDFLNFSDTSVILLPQKKGLFEKKKCNIISISPQMNKIEEFNLQNRQKNRNIYQNKTITHYTLNTRVIFGLLTFINDFIMVFVIDFYIYNKSL